MALATAVHDSQDLSGLLLKNMTNTTKTKLTAVFIALSLCVTWFFFSRAAALGNRYNKISPSVFQVDSRLGYSYDEMPVVFKPRIGGIWMAGRLIDAVTHDGRVTEAAFWNVFGLYHAGALLLTFVVLICLADNPLFVIPLVFAGMCYSLTPPDDVTIFPWDLPSMLFWTLSFLLWQRKHYFWMLATLVLGTVFKETVAVTAFLFFFTTISWRQRWTYFGAAFVACLLLRLWITHAVMGQARVFTAETQAHPGFNALESLFTPHLNHFIWVNAGTFILALLLPMKALVDKGTKSVLALFFAGMTLACYLANTDYEFRQFLDVLPVSVIYLSRTVEQWRGLK
jgi:hypothetical protein